MCATANNDGKPDSPADAGRVQPSLGGSPDRLPWPLAEQDDGKMNLKETFASVDAQLDDPVTWGRDGSYVKRCNPSCRTNEGNMHTKMFVFSRTAGASDVVMVSSSNLNRGGATLGWNDMYVIKDRPKSYGEYVRVHRVMTAGTPAPTSVIEIIDGPYTSRFFPIRNAGRNKDPVLKDLNKVRCRSALGRTRINISMFFWKGTRGNYITDQALQPRAQRLRGQDHLRRAVPRHGRATARRRAQGPRLGSTTAAGTSTTTASTRSGPTASTSWSEAATRAK